MLINKVVPFAAGLLIGTTLAVALVKRPCGHGPRTDPKPERVEYVIRGEGWDMVIGGVRGKVVMLSPEAERKE